MYDTDKSGVMADTGKDYSTANVRFGSEAVIQQLDNFRLTPCFS